MTIVNKILSTLKRDIMATIVLKVILVAFMICKLPESYGLKCLDGGSQAGGLTGGVLLPSSKECASPKICKNETKCMFSLIRSVLLFKDIKL